MYRRHLHRRLPSVITVQRLPGTTFMELTNITSGLTKKKSLEKSIASVVCDGAGKVGMNKLTIKGQFESRIFLIPRLNTIEAQKLNRAVSVPDQQIRAQWFCETYPEVRLGYDLS